MKGKNICIEIDPYNLKNNKKENVLIQRGRTYSTNNNQEIIKAKNFEHFLNPNKSKNSKKKNLQNNQESNQVNEEMNKPSKIKKQLESKCPQKDFFLYNQNTGIDIERQTINGINDYAELIDKNMKILEKSNLSNNCLEHHEIQQLLRTKMVDWMVEVLTTFKSREPTFFLSVSIMDRYLKNKKDPLTISDLHLVGIACMYISSKVEDIYPLRMSSVYEKIGHKKFSIA